MKNVQKIRRISLAFFLILMSYLGYRHQLIGGGSKGAPSVDALCPFGGMEGLYGVVVEGSWIQRIAPSSMVLFIAVGVMTILLGRVFCGWICPMGAITEFTSMIARKLGFKKKNLPQKLDKTFRLIKYFLLIIIIYFTWKLGILVFREYDPWKAWMHLTVDFDTAFIVLLLVIAAEFFIERFWCRYFCPLGALLGILQFFSITKISRTSETCISCHKCDRVCITGLKPSQELRMKSLDCMSCGTCVSQCPKGDTLNFKVFGKVISPIKAGVIGLAIFTIFWGGAKLTNQWKTFAPVKLSENMLISDQIRGWMTIKDIAELLSITPAEVKSIAELPKDMDENTSIKELVPQPSMVKNKLQQWNNENKGKQ